MTTPKIHGLDVREIQWQPDFSASQDENGLWRGTQSFICRKSDVGTVIPAKGTPCPADGFGFMGSESSNVADLKGDLYRITVSFVGANDEYQNDDNPEDSNGTNELVVSTSARSILYHPRYRNVSANEKQTLKLLLEGQLDPIDSVSGTPVSIRYRDANVTNAVEIRKLTSAKAVECALKIMRGITEYVAAEQIFRRTEVSTTQVPAAKLNAVGKITTNPYAPAVADDRNWLYVGVNSVQEGNSYTHTFEWRLSDFGGWDTDLYENNDDA